MTHHETKNNEIYETSTGHEWLAEETPRIWIASLADYVGGTLTGDWVDADVDAETLFEAASEILQRSETPHAEEFAIFDYENFGPYRIGEYCSLELVSKVACGIRDYGPAYAAWADECDGDLNRIDQFADAYLGEYDSLAAWGEEVLDDCGVMQELEKAASGQLQYYVHLDYEGWARDAWLSGDVTVIERPDGGVWLFDGHV